MAEMTDLHGPGAPGGGQRSDQFARKKRSQPRNRVIKHVNTALLLPLILSFTDALYFTICMQYMMDLQCQIKTSDFNLTTGTNGIEFAWNHTFKEVVPNVPEEAVSHAQTRVPTRKEQTAINMPPLAN